MNKEDIKLIKQILRKRGRNDLADLLSEAEGYIDESSTYGNYLFSTISQYLFYLPLKNFYKARQLSNDDRQTLLDSVLDLYPHEAEAPEITSVDFRIMKKEDKVSNLESVENDEPIKIQQDKVEEEIFKLTPEFYGIGINIKSLWKKLKSLFRKQ